MSVDPSDKDRQESAPTGIQPLPLLPFDVQLQNVFPIEIVARRFPIEMAVSKDIGEPVGVQTELNLNEPGIDAEVLRAQIHLDVRVSFPQEPRLFEIYFKLVGIFSYEKYYKPESVLNFLQHGSLSVLLPSARELLLSLCTRLQVPMVVLPLVRLAQSAPSLETSNVFHNVTDE